MIDFPPTGVDEGGTDKAQRIRRRYVFTDVDNTLAGYLSPIMFPGAIRFLYELRGDMEDAIERLVAPKVMVLSARPDISRLAPKIEKYFVVEGDNFYGGTLHGKPVKDCLIEDLKHFHQERADVAICRALARRKFCNMQEWLKRNRGSGDDCGVIFIGDNGEGDSLAAKEMLSFGLIDCAFIRRVQPDDRVIFVGHIPTDMPFKNLFYFNNFSEASQLAYDAGLLSPAAYHRIEEAFAEESKLASVLRAEEKVPFQVRIMREHATQHMHHVGAITPLQRWNNRCHIIPLLRRGRSLTPLPRCDAQTDKEMHESLLGLHPRGGNTRSFTPT
jgi:hypothetical protein